jgi:hypothetical protein
LAAALALTAGGAVARPAAAGPVDAAAYDRDLCALAQRLVVNAEAQQQPAFALSVLTGDGAGFHTIQMDVDAATRTVVIATTTATVPADGGQLATHVACKMVDRERVNDVLKLQLDGEHRSCRDVNEFTYRTALASLSADERRRYENSGRRLRFGDDYLAATGGEWLPVAVDEFIGPADGSPAGSGDLAIRAPSVRVRWNPVERSFFQGTQHCKLITLAAMLRWMRVGAFSTDAGLFPHGKPRCDSPSRESSAVGSCVFYFAPASARFCQDYSGSRWTNESARAECGRRHASPEALRAAANRYAGAGGIFSELGCAERRDRPALTGTCVFHCRQPDETLWHTLEPPAGAAAASAMMTRACDLFLPR